MMSNKFFIFLLSMTVLSACAKVTEDPVPTENEGITYTLKGILSDKTRALISDEGAFSWESGDKVAVLDSNTGDLCEFTSKDGDGIFTFTGEPGREYVFTKAWYPASMAKSDDVLSFPSSWEYSAVSAAHNFPMAAAVQNGEMHFYHLCALLKVTVNNVPKNATALSLSSPSVSLSGDFNVVNLGLDDGRIDATGENVIVEDGEIAVNSVPEIDSDLGEGSVSVLLDLSEKQTISVYIPLPCGSYKYSVKLAADEATVLQRTTSSAKNMDRAALIRMSALNVSWPATTLQACYDDVTVDFGPSDLWGWWKASSLPVEKDISIVDSGTSAQYGVKHSTQKRAGYMVQCLSGGSARTFPLHQASDIYIASDCSKFFFLAAGTGGIDVEVPSEYEVAHFDLRGNFDGSGYKTIGNFIRAGDKAPVEGWGWYVVRNVSCSVENIDFKLYANAPYVSEGLVVTSTATRQNAGIGRTLTWDADGQYSIAYRVTPGACYDFYLREDLQQVIVYESGSQGPMYEDRIVGLSQYGLYYYGNSSWVYSPGIDQYWVSGTSPATFVMTDGITFDQVQVDNLPSAPLVGDSVSVTITVTPTIGSVRTSTVSANVVKVAGAKVWLLTSDGTGMIVSVQ